MTDDNYRIAAADGISLQVYRWLPDGPARACVQLIHGLSEHAARYAGLAGALTAAGYAVYAHDQRGHGATASAADLGFVAAEDGWRRLQDDVLAVHGHIQEQQPDLPHILLGHSMGSLVAQQFAIEHGELLDGLVLSATTFRTDPLPGFGHWLAERIIRRRGPRHPSALLDFLSLGALRYTIRNRRTIQDWLSRDPAVVDAYIADPLCGRVPAASLWRDVYDGVRFVAQARHQSRLPSGLRILLMAGGADVISGGGKQVRRLAERYREVGVDDVECIIYPDARHEIFNEINRGAVYTDLLAWLNSIPIIKTTCPDSGQASYTHRLSAKENGRGQT
jgi:alpha-beta hydrolase superfamily lysophospholipase